MRLYVQRVTVPYIPVASGTHIIVFIMLPLVWDVRISTGDLSKFLFWGAERGRRVRFMYLLLGYAYSLGFG